MSEAFLKIMWEVAEAVLSKPPEKREPSEIESMLAWFRQRSSLFKTLEDDIMEDIIKNVKLARFRRDSIIARQGEIGHCFFIILKGSVSVYAKKEGEAEPHVSTETSVRSHQERTILFGTELSTLKAGRSFGESVMMGERRRNATIIADEATTLVSIDENLYKRSLQGYNSEWQCKTDFVMDCPLFRTWPNAYKSLLVENLRAHKINFGNLVVRQNTPCHSVFFIAKGMAKVYVEPRIAALQFKSMTQTKHKQVVISRPATPAEDDSENVSQRLTVIQKRRKRQLFGYAAMERRLRARTIPIAIIGENDVIGDLEMALDLSYFSASVECLEPLECYELDKPSFHRLIVKRNPETLELIRNVAIAKLKFRAKKLEHVQYYSLLLDRASEDYKGPGKTTKPRPKTVAQALIGFLGVTNKAVNKSDLFKRLSLATPLSTTGSSDTDPAASTPTVNTDERRPSESREKDRRRGEKKDAKKQYTAEEFRALKKKVQSTGKLIGRVSD